MDVALEVAVSPESDVYSQRVAVPSQEAYKSQALASGQFSHPARAVGGGRAFSSCFWPPQA
eukprot:11225365-Lingulodinium_polyedra.AAC.1